MCKTHSATELQDCCFYTWPISCVWENVTISLNYCGQHVLWEFAADYSTTRAAHPSDRHLGEALLLTCVAWILLIFCQCIVKEGQCLLVFLLTTLLY